MNLGNIKAPQGAGKSRKRVGRGSGSGHGKTSCRGHKGQRARSGGRGKTGFEGGQNPLQRRIPKRGFTNIFKKVYSVVNIHDLECFESGSTVDAAAFISAGLVRKVNDGIKLLAHGDIKKPLIVKIDKASEAAVNKIGAAGGRVEVQ